MLKFRSKINYLGFSKKIKIKHSFTTRISFLKKEEKQKKRKQHLTYYRNWHNKKLFELKLLSKIIIVFKNRIQKLSII